MKTSRNWMVRLPNWVASANPVAVYRKVSETEYRRLVRQHLNVNRLPNGTQVYTLE